MAQSVDYPGFGDPIGFSGGDTDLYAYVRNNSILFSNAYGRDVIVTTYHGGPGNPFGHIGVGVNSCKTEGFYDLPMSIPTPNGISINTHITSPILAPGIVLPDDGTPLNSVRIPTSPQQDQAVQAFIKSVAANPGFYSGLFGRDCATFVSQAVQAANIPINPSRFPKAPAQRLMSTSLCQ